MHGLIKFFFPDGWVNNFPILEQAKCFISYQVCIGGFIVKNLGISGQPNKPVNQKRKMFVAALNGYPMV